MLVLGGVFGAEGKPNGPYLSPSMLRKHIKTLKVKVQKYHRLAEVSFISV